MCVGTQSCFNGATTLQPWKYQAKIILDLAKDVLQWGHDFAAVEILELGISEAGKGDSFNGATTLQPWKCTQASS